MDKKHYSIHLSEIEPIEGAAGRVYQLLNNEFMVVGRVLLEPGRVHPPKSHDNEEECFFILAGEGVVTLDSEDIPVTAGSFVYIPRGTVHSVKNSGAGPLEYIFFGAFQGERHP
ncbi:MAG TPA: cupin domain-containing protein [Firmicutes bacterium]|nr:cupin domain-containing protein [Bacillota bacterium]